MKFILIITGLLSIALLAINCKSNKPKYTTETLPEKQIRWGSGGGFTGKVTTFTLLENGQLFEHSSLTQTTAELPATKAKTAKGMFSAATNLDLANIKIDSPGNMYYFVETKDGEATNRIVWGDDKMPVEQKVKDFYTVLQQLVTKTN